MQAVGHHWLMRAAALVYSSGVTITVSAVNFGPIAEGTVEILPFTVFIGPNNTGKSFISTLIYAAELNARKAYSLRNLETDTPMPSSPISRVRDAVLRNARRPDADLSKSFSSMPRSSRNSLMALAREELTIYARILQVELERCLGGRIDDLASVDRSDESPMELSVQDNSLSWHVQLSYTNKTIDITVRPPSSNNVLEWADKYSESVFEKYFPRGEKPNSGITIPRSQNEQLSKQYDELLTQVVDLLAARFDRSLHDFLFQNFPVSCHYLPAARSGIMQSHKSLAAFLVRSAPLVGLQQMAVPQLSGIVTDFISQLLSLDNRRRRAKKTDLEPVAEELETQVLHGKIEMRAVPSGYPEIIYRVGRLEAPLVRLSSMISELAPVVLYIRYVLAQGHHLIIEEPEAHLHPESQRLFAQILADLLGLGVAITMTTHSDYLLTEINNLIREQTVADVTGSKASPRSIPSSLVAAYLFKRESGEPGTAIQKLMVSESEGISDEEFGRVTEAIYNDAANLQYEIIKAREEHDI